MAQSKVIKYELEQLVLERRGAGRTNQQIADACSAALRKRRIADTLTSKAIERYLAKLDRATVPVAHEPQVAAENARLAVDVADRINLLDGTLERWLGEAESAVCQMRGVVYDQATGEIVSEKFARQNAEGGPVIDVFVADWGARLGTAKQMRQLAETVVNLLERIHNAQQIEAFQASVLEAIKGADPDTAQRVVTALQRHQSIQRAALLGPGA